MHPLFGEINLNLNYFYINNVSTFFHLFQDNTNQKKIINNSYFKFYFILYNKINYKNPIEL